MLAISGAAQFILLFKHVQSPFGIFVFNYCVTDASALVLYSGPHCIEL